MSLPATVAFLLTALTTAATSSTGVVTGPPPEIMDARLGLGPRLPVVQYDHHKPGHAGGPGRHGRGHGRGHGKGGPPQWFGGPALVPGIGDDPIPADPGAGTSPVPTPPGTPPTTPVDPTLPVPAPTTGEAFTLASFNVLGHSHTARGKKRAWPDSSRRMDATLRLLAARSVDLVGLQEFQPIQRAMFLNRAGGTYAVYGAPGDPENSVAWRKSRFTFVDGWTIPIPYFYGRIRQMPVVTLKSNQTGELIRILNVHNPADRGRNARQTRHRAEATRREMAAVDRLRDPNIPMFVTGDMNDRDAFFCQFGRTGMKAAAGGSVSPAGCVMPPYGGVDWIFGSPEIVFADYVTDRAPKAARVSDHPLVSATVTLP